MVAKKEVNDAISKDAHGFLPKQKAQILKNTPYSVFKWQARLGADFFRISGRGPRWVLVCIILTVIRFRLPIRARLVSLSLSLSLSLPPSLSLSLSLTHTHSHTLSLSRARARVLSLSHIYACTKCNVDEHTHTSIMIM